MQQQHISQYGAQQVEQKDQYYPQPQYTVQQPIQQPMMMAVRPNPLNVPIGPDGNRDFSKGLCDCCTDGCSTCMVATFCSCFLYADIEKRLDSFLKTGRPASEPADFCTGACCGYVALNACCGLSWVFSMAQRTRVRDYYGIRGESVGDCCATYWCTPCTMVQAHAELKAHEDSFGGQSQKY